MAAAFRDVEAATLALDGSPPITRITFPTCRAHYPGGSSGCACRLLPRSYSLPQMAGGSASALSLSRPAQASLTLRPAGLLNRLKAAFVTRLQPCRLPGRTARQLPDQSTTPWVESSSTSDPRLRGALPYSDIGCPAFGTPSGLSATHSPLHLGGKAIQQVLLFPLSPTLFNAPKSHHECESNGPRTDHQWLPTRRILPLFPQLHPNPDHRFALFIRCASPRYRCRARLPFDDGVVGLN